MALTKATYSLISGAMLNALDFGMGTTKTAAQNKSALQAAIAANTNGKTIYIPAGVYQIDGDIDISTYMVRIEGENTAYTYYPISSSFGTTLVFVSGTRGFNAGTTDSDFSSLANITLDGNNVCTIGYTSGGCKQFTNVTIRRFTNIGFDLVNLTNSTIIEDCAALDNGVGIKVTGLSTTPYSIRNTNIRRNVIGITLEAGVLGKIDKCIIESNTYLGVYINGQTGSALGTVTFDSCWFENNAYTSGLNTVIITNDINGEVYDIEFRNCLWDTPHHLDVLIQQGNNIVFYYCRFSLGGVKNVTINAPVTYTQFYKCNRGLSQGTQFAVLDNGQNTYIQDYAFQLLGQNVVDGVNWINTSYGGFAQTAGKITAANSASGSVSCYQPIGNTYKDQAYFVSVNVYVISGESPLLTVYAGDGTTVLYQATANTGLTQFRYVETVTGTSAKLVFSNTAACSFYMDYATLMNQTTVGYVRPETW